MLNAVFKNGIVDENKRPSWQDVRTVNMMDNKTKLFFLEHFGSI